MPLKPSSLEVCQSAMFFFKSQVKSPTPEIERINGCRSSCKDFWREVYLVLDDCDETCHGKKLATWKSRHSRFVQAVRPIDILEGYDSDGQSDWVYEKHKKFE